MMVRVAGMGIGAPPRKSGNQPVTVSGHPRSEAGQPAVKCQPLRGEIVDEINRPSGQSQQSPRPGSISQAVVDKIQGNTRGARRMIREQIGANKLTDVWHAASTA